MTESFYLHIPFCRQKCRYCKFALTPVFSDAKVTNYLEYLKNEAWECLSRDSRLRGNDGASPIVKTIYFGGGTPSILTIEQIREILDVFREYRIFDEDIEITLEANPEDISAGYVRWLREVGINRLSLGIQTLNNTSLTEIGRAPSETIFRALDAVAASTFENIGTDWILGLPHVASGEILRNIREILGEYPIKHLSLYMLESDHYPSHWKSVSTNDNEIRDEYLAIRDFLTTKWFVQYELSNFAIPWYESSHNQSYWNHTNYRGFGLSAASYEDGRRFANSTSFAGYYRWELSEDEYLTEDQKRIERCMFSIRTDGVSESDLRNHEKLEGYISEWLLRRQDGKILPTSTWIFLADHIIGELI